MTRAHEITDEDVRERLRWLRNRQGVFGGSDAPAVFGFSDYRDALDVYHSKTREITEEDAREDLESSTIDIWRGNRNERDAVRIFLQMRGYEGRWESRQIYASGSDRIAVHVDGTVYADDSREPPRDETGVVEAKSPRLQTFSKLVAEGVDPYYTIQLQFNCAVTRRPWGALAIFSDQHEAGPVIPIEAEADPTFGRMLLARAEEFMRDHVEARVPPDPDDWSIRTPESVEVLAGRSGEYELIDDPEFGSLSEELMDRYLLQKYAKESYESLREDVQAWIESHTETDAVLTPSGEKLRVVRRDGRSYLQEDQLRDHGPLDRDAFERAVRAGLIELPGFDDLGEAFSALALDFGRFEREGSPSAYVRAYPSGDRKERMERAVREGDL